VGVANLSDVSVHWPAASPGVATTDIAVYPFAHVRGHNNHGNPHASSGNRLTKSAGEAKMTHGFSFDVLEERLDNLMEQIAVGNIGQIESEANRLADDLADYAAIRQRESAADFGPKLCREMAHSIRDTRRHSQHLEIAAYFVKQAERRFKSSSFYREGGT
jgi:hypothetical protein